MWKWNYEFICFALKTLLFQIGNNPLTTTGAMDLVMAVSGDNSRVRLLDMIVCNTFIHKLTKCLLLVVDFLGQDIYSNTLKESKISSFFLMKPFIVHVLTTCIILQTCSDCLLLSVIP